MDERISDPCTGRVVPGKKCAHKVAYRDQAGRSITLYGELWVPAGEGRHPAVILSHGFNGHCTDFPLECARLVEKGYLCCAADFCGAQAGGKSTGRNGEEYTPGTMVEDLKAVIREIRGLEQADGQLFLFGGSQGGLVTGLAAADPEVRDWVTAIAMYFPAFCIPENWKGVPAQTTELMGWRIGAEYIREVQNLDPYRVIPEYPGEVCIVWGDLDRVVPADCIDRAVLAYRGDLDNGQDSLGLGFGMDYGANPCRNRVQLTIIPGAGHGFIGEAAEQATETVLAFLEAHRKAGQQPAGRRR